MFEVTADEIALLDDKDLRELVGRLCESELRKRGISPACVTWGGDQNAGDGGVDVRVSLPPQVEPGGFIPRSQTGFQVKAEDTPASKIAFEMRPDGALRPSIRELAERSGAYIIVSSKGSTSDVPLRKRREAMAQAISDAPNAGALALDFYDRKRLETCLRDHVGTALWVREKIGKPLQGWSGYAAWSHEPEGTKDEYLLDKQLRFKRSSLSGESGLPAVDGINSIRGVLDSKQGVVRLIGMSGLGKTRLVEALFDARVGERSLDPGIAAYTNLSNGPIPEPTTMLSELISTAKRAVLVVDNCPPALHQRLSEICRSEGSQVSLITIEYDIREDQAEGTDVFALEVASIDLVDRLIRRRFPKLSPVDARRIAQFSGANPRIALALAARIGNKQTIATLSDDALFRRLFEQRHETDQELLLVAEALSLVYSFNGEDVSGEEGDELSLLGPLVERTAHELYKHCAELERRGLVQRRGPWRAVLPPAIANRLASMALQNIPPTTLATFFEAAGRERLLRSFSRRLGYLSGTREAQLIVNKWLGPGGLLSNLLELGELGRVMFDNVAPVAPLETLGALERVLGALHNPDTVRKCQRYLAVLRLLAHDAALFDRCVALIEVIARAGEADNDRDESRRVFTSLFPILYSGTHATLEQRLTTVRLLVGSNDAKQRTLGLSAMKAMLEATHFSPPWDFEFGARSRDYGYAPATRDDVKRWFGQTIDAAVDRACSESPIAAEARDVLAQQFRGLWSRGGMYNELERACKTISNKSFWPEGWIAVRQTMHYDSSGFAPDVSSRLASLEAALRPRDLVSRVRSIVLSDDVTFCGVDSTVDASTDVQQILTHVETLSRELGTLVAADNEALTRLLPDLVTHRSQQLWQFGVGLAEGATERRSVWKRLVAQLGATPSNAQSVQVIAGFLSALNTLQSDLCDSLLDDAIDNEVLGAWYPPLQTVVGIDTNGLDRLMRSIDVGKASISAYRSLAGGGVTHKLPGRDFNRLLLRIAARAGGLDVAFDILRMRILFEGRLQSSTEELVEIGCELTRRIPFEGARNDIDSHNLGIIIRACLLGEKGAAAVREICANLKSAVSASETYPFHQSEVLKFLLRMQPLAALQALCGESEGDLRLGMRILRDAGQLRGNPFDEIPDSDLLNWCDEKTEIRYPAAAAGVTSFEWSAEAARQKWTKTALLLVDKAPDRVAVIKSLMGNFSPAVLTGSDAAASEANTSLLDDLGAYPDPAVVAFIATEKPRLKSLVEEEQRIQRIFKAQMRQHRHDESFE